jgi:two-component system alkaline phosphatase synthesis response regulator PhoP
MNPPKKILVVEDDPDLMAIACDKLVQGGFAVTKAKDGKEGLAAALAQHPELILLDYTMPQMNGMEMLKALRQDEWGKDAQVFMFTSMEGSKEMSEGMHYNVAKYLIKSNINYDELLAEIKQYLH